MSEFIEGFEDGWLLIVLYKWLFVEKFVKCLIVCFSVKVVRVLKSYKVYFICFSLVIFVCYVIIYCCMICEF